MKIFNIITSVLLLITYPIGWFCGTGISGLSGLFLSIYCMYTFFFRSCKSVGSSPLSFSSSSSTSRRSSPSSESTLASSSPSRAEPCSFCCICCVLVLMRSVASMAFGASFWLNYLSGIIGVLVAFFNCFVTWKHPSFQKGGEFYKETIESLSNVCRRPLSPDPLEACRLY